MWHCHRRPHDFFGNHHPISPQMSGITWYNHQHMAALLWQTWSNHRIEARSCWYHVATCMYIYIHMRLYVQWKVPVYQPEIITDIDQKWICHIFPWSHCIPMSISLKCILPLYSIILHLVRILLYSHEIPMKTPRLPHLAGLGAPNAWLSSCSWECWNSATDHRLSMEFFHLPSDNQRWQWNNHCKCSF